MDQYRALLDELRRVDALDRGGFLKSTTAADVSPATIRAETRSLREMATTRPDFDGLLKSLDAMKTEAHADLRAARHADLERKFAAASAHFDDAIRSGRISAVQAAKVESLMARLAAEAGLS